MYKFYLKSVTLCAFLSMAFPTNAQEGKLPTDEETSWEHAPRDYQIPQGLVRGASFIDRILPMPDPTGGLRSDVWGGPNVKPRNVENGIEHPDWSFWCRGVRRMDDGKYHLFGARWPEDKGFDYWPQSRVYHAVSDHPCGPFKVVDEDIAHGHNVTIYRAKDGRYVIGAIYKNYIADSYNGPWSPIKIEFDFRGGSCPDDSNNTYAERPDGSVLMINQPGRVWISEDGVKPFRKVTDSHGIHPCTLGIFEDPIVWRDEVQYNAIYNDWYGRTAYYMRSKDGVNWVWDQGIAYDVNVARHSDGTIERWYKFERPSILQDEYGRATHLYFAAIDSRKDLDLPNDNHNTKNIALPLVVQRRLELTDHTPLAGKTTVKVRIKAEPGFDPLKEVEVKSLHFGAPSAVDFGKGLVAVRREADGNDLIVTFSGKSAGFTEKDFVGKLLGNDTKDNFVFGFVRLPGVDFDEPILNANRPMLTGSQARFVIENFGTHTSDSVEITCESTLNEQHAKHTSLKMAPIPAYGNTSVEIPLNSDAIQAGNACEYIVTMSGGGVPFVHSETIIRPTASLAPTAPLALPTGDSRTQQPLVMATGKTFEKGFALRSPDTVTWLLDGSYNELELYLGAAKASLGGSVVEIWTDGKLVNSTPLLRPKSIYQEDHHLTIPLKGIRILRIACNRFFVNDVADVASGHVIVGKPVLKKQLK